MLVGIVVGFEKAFCLSSRDIKRKPALVSCERDTVRRDSGRKYPVFDGVDGLFGRRKSISNPLRRPVFAIISRIRM